MKILLTGCAGFIGSHTAERLLNLDHKVIGIDNFSSFYSKEIKEANLSHFIKHPNFVFHEVDIRHKAVLYEVLKEPVDLVVHLAAKAGVRPSINDPEAYIDVNLKGTQHILQWMKDKGVKKMFFASSSSVYGNNDSGEALSEHKYDVKPISPYAFTKRAAELMNHSYHHLYDMDILNARFFTVFGPRQRPDLAIHKFVQLIANGKAIEMYGDGSTARDYTYVDDTVDGILAGIDFLSENNNVFETINLGNQHPVSLKQMIEVIYAKMDKEPRVDTKSMQEGDVNLTYADISKAKSLLNYEPKTKFEDGVAKFVAWYNQQPKRI